MKYSKYWRKSTPKWMCKIKKKQEAVNTPMKQQKHKMKCTYCLKEPLNSHAGLQRCNNLATHPRDGLAALTREQENHLQLTCAHTWSAGQAGAAPQLKRPRLVLSASHKHRNHLCWLRDQEETAIKEAQLSQGHCAWKEPQPCPTPSTWPCASCHKMMLPIQQHILISVLR